MSRFSGLGNRLYSSETSIDIVGRRKTWYGVSTVLAVLCFVALLWNGLTPGIEFTGGAEFSASKAGATIVQSEEVRENVESAGIEGVGEVRVTIVGNPERVRVQTGTLTAEESLEIRDVIAETLDVDSDAVTVQVVGASWGGEITNKALQGLIAFLIAVVIYLSIAFEWRMAAAALVALMHDVFITVGVYALVGFDVTPATVIGLLTILGYSLYDTVVVFDKVRENTKGITAQSKYTYSEAANLAVNQTLVRSINTSIIALLPVASILFVGAGLLGAGTLKDLALALFVGIAVGTYSSVLIATPLLAHLKEKDPEIAALHSRVMSRRANAKRSDGSKAPAVMSVGATGVAVVESGERHQPSKKSTRAQRKGR